VRFWLFCGVLALLVVGLWAGLSWLRPFGPAPAASAPDARVTEGKVSGEVAPLGARPGPTATPRAVFFRRESYGPVKIDPGTVHRLELGRLEPGTLVRAVITVQFNSRLSNLTGVPDLDVAAVGPSGVVSAQSQARNGYQLSFQAPTSGEYAVELSNARSRINAKLVGVQFLQP
jgi:hypothetical protein